jgi:hypothetical protein
MKGIALSIGLARGFLSLNAAKQRFSARLGRMNLRPKMPSVKR